MITIAITIAMAELKNKKPMLCSRTVNNYLSFGQFLSELLTRSNYIYGLKRCWRKAMGSSQSFVRNFLLNSLSVQCNSSYESNSGNSLLLLLLVLLFLSLYHFYKSRIMIGIIVTIVTIIDCCCYLIHNWYYIEQITN